jgi:hypothetical protein
VQCCQRIHLTVWLEWNYPPPPLQLFSNSSTMDMAITGY